MYRQHMPAMKSMNAPARPSERPLQLCYLAAVSW